MNLMNSLRQWWQEKTGEEETPFDGDTPAFFVSMFTHIVIMLVLAFSPIMNEQKQVTLLISAPPTEEEQEVDDLKLPQQVQFSEQPSERVGANSMNGEDVALSQAPTVSPEFSEIPSPSELTPTTEFSNLSINVIFDNPVGLTHNANLAVKGAMGQGETGASGAVDRITQEILRSLEERKTLVVWVMDQTASLRKQRQAIHDRLDKIYDELGVLEAAGNSAFARHKDKPLLTSVITFGSSVNLRTKEPTDNLAEIKKAILEVDDDNSGVERVFSAIHAAAEKYKFFRIPDEASRSPERNVMIIAFTDEAGSDQQEGLEPTVKICRRYEMPVYVIGVPAPFGRKETLVKWVDPDPKFDQTPQWGEVEQGPESFLPERIKLNFSGAKEDDDPIDSGFGPYALTRLCYETGGIYFAVHPNRNVNRAVNRGEVDTFSAHLKYFFDPEVMRKYRPDYVSPEEYKRRVTSNKSRAALVEASRQSWLTPMESPTLKFVKRSEPELANALTEAQKDAAKVEPKIEALYGILKLGEADREKENALRWQAGYDLAMGRVLAVKVRTETYNAMLAQAKRGLKFKEEKNNTWVLEPSDEISVGSQLEKLAERAKMYLNRVVKDHPGTPWAMLAERELKDKIGWKWKEEFTDMSPPAREGAGNNNNNVPAPANDKAKMMKKAAPPKRPIPKL